MLYINLGDNMNKIKIYFCLFLLVLSILYINTKLKTIDMYGVIFNKDITSIVDSPDIKIKNLVNKSNDKESNIINVSNNKKLSNKPLVYLYNTHQTEEFKSSKSYKPTVVTASNIISKTLKKDKISSLVETKSIKKKLDYYGYDYSGTYAVSFEYLKERKKENPTLNYFFDIHRDSITGPYSKVTIKNKKYATMMFLVGQNHKNYKKNVNNLKIMEDYLKKKYSGLVRDTYYQPKYKYNQDYSENMFLVEIGGPENTLEEITNTSIALAHAISYYVEKTYEK